MNDTEQKPAPTKEFPSAELVETVLENQAPVLLEVSVGNSPKGAAIFYPDKMHFKSAKEIIDQFRLVPESRVGIHTANRVESLIDLTNRFKDDETSVIFAEAKVTDTSISASITAILDFHPKTPKNEDARAAKHKIFYNFPVSSVFAKWLKTNGVVMDQKDFAVFLEDHIGELVSGNEAEKALVANLTPKFAEPLEMLALARDLNIYSSETLEQGYKPSSGERKLKFQVQHKDASGNVLTIPDFFVIDVPMFEAGASKRVMVKLRYRSSEKGAFFFYELYRVDKMLEAAFNTAVDEVKEKTALPLFIGKAAS